MTTTTVPPKAPRARRVSFPDLVRIHYRWRKLVGDDSTASAEERQAIDEEYHAALERFEDEHGELVNAYWCVDVESAVALTAGRPSPGWVRRLLSVSPKFHRVSDWATQDEPELARLLHQCDELAVRSSEVLRGRSRRIFMQLVMTSACHVLSLVDARRARPTPEARRAAIAAEGRELKSVADGYRQAANGDAQLVYFGGMGIGALVLVLLYVLGVRGALTADGVQDSTIAGCLVAGALGAVVSVIARVNSGSFDLDADISRGYTLFLGALRPVIGSIFGVLTYFAVTSGFVEIFKLPPDGLKQFYFLCVIAFGAGFSERWAQDTLTGGLGGRASKTEPEPKPDAVTRAKRAADERAAATADD
jgi:hypothetical protein